MPVGLHRPTLPVTIHRSDEPLLDDNGEQIQDDYGVPQYGDVDIDTRAIRIAKVRGQEISVNRQTVVITATIAFPPDEDIRVTDDISTWFADHVRRFRVLTTWPQWCSRTRRIKHIACDLELIEDG